jgi:hypothetical protein
MSDRSFQVLLVLLSVLLGAGITVLIQWLSKQREMTRQEAKKAQDSRKALSRLKKFIGLVTERVAHGHEFVNRGDLAQELEEIAGNCRAWLDEDLYLSIKQVAWRIRDNDFDHETQKDSSYCCDELLGDLHFLALALLPAVALDEREKDEEAKLHVQELVRAKFEILFDEQYKEQFDQLYKKWKTGTLQLGKGYAVAGYWNQHYYTPPASEATPST